MINVYAIEGIDRLGKSTLIKNIKNALGYFEVIHFEKPQRLEVYKDSVENPLKVYQEESFRNSMLIAKSGARVIFDRWHLGEMVYSPMYRGYSGDYVMDLEESTNVIWTSNLRLVLLVEDFEVSKHFVDDGESFDIARRADEQAMFIDAFNKSKIIDKRIVCVTDRATGGFKPQMQILQEVISNS